MTPPEPVDYNVFDLTAEELKKKRSIACPAALSKLFMQQRLIRSLRKLSEIMYSMLTSKERKRVG